MRNYDLTPYLDRIYGYAVKRTYSREEAEELSQEIVLAALRAVHELRDESRFEPWLWGVAANVTRSFRRMQGRARAMYVWDAWEALGDTPASEDEDVEAEYAELRAKIAGLSAIYREIIILHYYDGLSINEIAAKLGIPAGTVTWRLSAARSKLKKECANMNESALRPVRFKLEIYGSGNFDPKRGIPIPTEYVSDALSLNILWQAYEEPRTVEELSDICGVPAYYVEDCLANLRRRRAVIEPSKGKYQTDFLIFTDKYAAYTEENAEAVLAPVMERLIDAVDAIGDELLTMDFYRGGKSEAELRCLAGIMAFCGMARFNPLDYPEIKPNYDGWCWRYLGGVENGKLRNVGVGIQQSQNLGSRGSYAHTVYFFTDTAYRSMMRDDLINVCEDILIGGATEDRDAAAEAVAAGYIVRREDGKLEVTTPAFTFAQKQVFDALAEQYLAPLMPEYTVCINRLAAGYRQLFPAHLADDAARMCQSLFHGMYDFVVRYARRTGRWAELPEGSVCDVLVQWKKK